MSDKQALLRNLPAVDKLLNAQSVSSLSSIIPHALLLEACQTTIDQLRQDILKDPARFAEFDLSIDNVASLAADQAQLLHRPCLRPVINATGTLLHTNLGRSPLSPAALKAVTEVSRGYSNLEFDLDSGARGHRYSHVESLLCKLTGAEAATVVNNNAGAVLLALTAMAKGREAIVSRGELVEIGGAFRVPDVMAAGGVILREVGTTNKTHMRDYRQAINDQTGLLLKVHTSNYRIVGFHSDVPAADLVGLGQEHRLPVLEDLGSGMLMDMTEFGLPREPTVREAVAAGVDVVTFSGDKLLGGPQAGLIVGRTEEIEKIRSNPMARALRIDKMTLAALEATLRPFLDRDQVLKENPVLRMLQIKPGALRQRTRRIKEKLQQVLGTSATVEIVNESSRVGGGALPLTELPGCALALAPNTLSVEDLASRLRTRAPEVIGRIQEGRLLLNLRTVSSREEKDLLRALAAALEA